MKELIEWIWNADAKQLVLAAVLIVLFCGWVRDSLR